MQYLVCTLPPTPARAPRVNPDLCACGQPLEMEMERDEGRCVNCAFAAAEAGRVNP